MKNWLLCLNLLCLITFSCREKVGKENTLNKSQHLLTDDYELFKSSTKTQAVLILFGGYPHEAADIKREFQIVRKALENQIDLVLMNYNQKLWLNEGELNELSALVEKLMQENDLSTEQLYLGGFSSGGNVALLLANHLRGSAIDTVQPEGIFVVDPPLDLAVLYASALKNIERNFSEAAVQESKWLIQKLDRRFGNPADSIKLYEQHSVFTRQTDHTDNLQALKGTKIRLYTEPDSSWWRENRGADFEQTNAFTIIKLAESLQVKGFEDVELITTQDRGYRADGARHPHSWSIVEIESLIKWIQEE